MLSSALMLPYTNDGLMGLDHFQHLPVQPVQGEASIHWYTAPQCGSPDEKTIVTLPSSVCHVLPSVVTADPAIQPPSSYKVECNAAGNGGAFVTFNSSTCGKDNVKGFEVLRFDNARCYTLEQLGGRTVSFDCAPLTSIARDTATIKGRLSGAGRAGLDRGGTGKILTSVLLGVCLAMLLHLE